MSPWYLCVKLSKELNHIGSKEGDSNELYSFFDDYKKDKPLLQGKHSQTIVSSTTRTVL